MIPSVTKPPTRDQVHPAQSPMAACKEKTALQQEKMQEASDYLTSGSPNKLMAVDLLSTGLRSGTCFSVTRALST